MNFWDSVGPSVAFNAVRRLSVLSFVLTTFVLKFATKLRSRWKMSKIGSFGPTFLLSQWSPIRSSSRLFTALSIAASSWRYDRCLSQNVYSNAGDDVCFLDRESPPVQRRQSFDLFTRNSSIYIFAFSHPPNGVNNGETVDMIQNAWFLLWSYTLASSSAGQWDTCPSTSSNIFQVFHLTLEPHKVYNGQLYLVLYSTELLKMCAICIEWRSL